MILFDVTTPLSIPARFLLGVGGGVAATLAMDLVMPRLPEGATPPTIAAGVLTDSDPDAAPERLAAVVHYVAGLLTGPLFVWLLYATEGVFGGQSLVTTVLAATVLYILMVGFFVVVVLPRSRVAGQRLWTIRRDWAVCALVYVVVLTPTIAVASTTL